MLSRVLLFLTLTLGFHSQSYAIPKIEVPDFNSEFKIKGSYGILKDDDRSLDQGQALAMEEKFLISPEQARNIGIYKGNIWLLFRFEYRGTGEQEYFLDFGNPLLYEANVFIIDDNSQLLKSHQVGLQTPFENLQIRSVKTMVPLLFQSGKSILVLAQVNSDFALGVAPALLAPKYYYEQIAPAHNLAQGAYAGVIASLFLYNLFLFWRLREKIFLWFTVNLLVCYLILIPTPLGFPLRYFLPEAGELGTRLVMACFGLSIFSMVLFSRDFLNLQKKAPLLNKIALYFAGTGILVMLAASTFSSQDIFKIACLITAVGLIFVFGCALHLSRLKHPPAILFLVAWTPLFLGVSFFLMGLAGWIRLSLQSAALSVLLLSALQTLAFTLALTAKISLRKKENQKLLAEKQQAEFERHALTAELQAGRVVQEAIQKPVDSVPGFRFSYHYQSATNIGGDWLGCAYDSSHRRTLLFICDVNGHGIAAGMLAGTVSGAVGGALAQTFGKNLDRRAQVSALLQAVNYVLLDWGHKSEKVATMAIVAIDDDTGEATLMNAGHTHVYTIRDGKARGLPSRGSILGLHQDPQFRALDFKLAADDLLFLYSDGLFENTNAKGEVIGLRSVTELFKTHRQPDELKQSLLALVEKSWGSESLADDFCFAFAQYTPRVKEQAGEDDSPLLEKV